MLTVDTLREANKALETIPLKGKNYAMVVERVKAFRTMVPNGCIETDILSMENGIVTMKAKVYDENGKLLATGLAQEKETSSFVNKTSYIENCETSAVGRALGMLGIGIDDSMASAEELVNAIKNQGDKKSRTDDIVSTNEKLTAHDRIVLFCNEHQLKLSDIMEQYGLERDMPDEVYAAKLSMLMRDYGGQ